MRVSVPRRHPLFADHFGNHLAPAGHFLILGHGEWADFARPVAIDAAGIQQPRDLVGVGHGRVFLGRADAADEAAFAFGRRHLHRLAGQKIVDGISQIFVLQLWLGIADAGPERELIVDSTLVADGSQCVENERFGRARCAELVGHLVADVFQNREREVVLPSEGVDFGDRILAVRVDADQRDAFLRELDRQFLQAVRVKFCQRALGAQKDDGHSLVLGEDCRERVLLPAEVLQRERIDLAADSRLDAERGTGQTHQQRCREDQPSPTEFVHRSPLRLRTDCPSTRDTNESGCLRDWHRNGPIPGPPRLRF